ncbi:M23 family metallopeptidase [Stenotrophomonas tumulicola]|nr:M23 family metallopeptidase [Stenotrophomonas tumulicola]
MDYLELIQRIRRRGCLLQSADSLPDPAMRRLPCLSLCLLPLLSTASPGSDWRNGWGLAGPDSPARNEAGQRLQDVAYRLPFDERRFSVGQAPQGRFSHRDAENRHAVDFTLPEGTPVLAARAGRVLDLQAGFSGNGLDPQHDRARANYVRIQHPDGSIAVYAHLQHDGVRVRQGQWVEAGQRIALSGNTGYSTAPHLHFAVQIRRGTHLESVPIRIVTARGQLHYMKGDGGD